MPETAHVHSVRQTLLAAIAAALLVLALLYAFSTRAPSTAHAQGGLSMAISKTLNGSPVVRVGQYITFTIRITNTGTISITRLPVIDDFDAKVLRLDQTDPPLSTADGGQITWTSLPTDTLGGPLPPGQTITILTRFRVIGISDLTINKVRVQDALGWGGQSGGGGSGQGGGKTEGGRVVVEKALAPGVTPAAGRPITFTVRVRNEGAADIVTAPVQDSYPAEYLQFWKADPPPSQQAPGDLRWGDALPSLGLTRLRPNEAITITTVFTALKAIDAGVFNRAGATGVRDEFQNELAAPRQAEVPIRILPGAGETQTATPRPRRPSERTTPTSEATATPVFTPAAAITTTAALTATAPISTPRSLTPAVTPARLPRSGGAEEGWLWPLAGLALLLGGMLTQAAARHRRAAPRR